MSPAPRKPARWQGSEPALRAVQVAFDVEEAVMEAASLAQAFERGAFEAQESNLVSELEEKGMEFVDVDSEAFAAAAKDAVLSSVSDEIRPDVEALFNR